MDADGKLQVRSDQREEQREPRFLDDPRAMGIQLEDDPAEVAHVPGPHCLGYPAEREAGNFHQSNPDSCRRPSQAARTSTRSQKPLRLPSSAPFEMPSGPKYVPAMLSSRVTVDVPDRCIPKTKSCM
jgi:hypothetical protein